MTRRSWLVLLLLTPASLFLLAFFVLPLVLIALYSFLTPGLYGGVEWAFYDLNYGRVLGWADGVIELFEPIYIYILLRSLVLAALTVLLLLIVCFPVAYWVAKRSRRLRLAFLFMIALPFFASLIVRLYAWLLILKPSGLLNASLSALGMATTMEFLYSPLAVVIGMVYIFIPFMFLPLFASIDNLDRDLTEASRDLGATPLQTFLKVTLPLTTPGIIGGSVIVFIPAVGNFIVPDLLGGSKGLMLGNLIEQQFLSSRNWPFGSALAMLVMFVVLMILLAFLSRLRQAEAAR